MHLRTVMGCLLMIGTGWAAPAAETNVLRAGEVRLAEKAVEHSLTETRKAIYDYVHATQLSPPGLAVTETVLRGDGYHVTYFDCSSAWPQNYITAIPLASNRTLIVMSSSVKDPGKESAQRKTVTRHLDGILAQFTKTQIRAK